MRSEPRSPEADGTRVAVENWFNSDAVRRVAEALSAANVGRAVNDCKVGDVSHVVELLVRLLVLEDASPGVAASLIDTFGRFVVRERDREALRGRAQRDADALGFGDEWAEAVKAGMTKRRTGYVPAMVRAVMKATGSTESYAVHVAAEHYGIDEESVRRAIRRDRRRGPA